jgi:quercetin dioxygenase-like cupin family protein
MARPGDVLLDPSTGKRLVFRRTSTQTAGRLLECDVYFGAREARPDEHAHRAQEHQIEVLSGSLKACLGGRVQALRPGDVLLIPPGDKHAVWNPSAKGAHVVWHAFPALETETRLEAHWQCAHAPAAAR